MLNKDHHNFVMYEALFSHGLHTDLAEKLSLFGLFVGSWDIEVISHLPDGNTKSVSGEWHFGWALEGRAILDVWITPRRELRGTQQEIGDYGTTLRFYDTEIDAWRSTWIGPVRRFVLPFIGRLVKGEIILEGSFEEGISSRWVFSDITTDAFKWRSVQSSDNWATHQLLQEIIAHRAINAPAI